MQGSDQGLGWRPSADVHDAGGDHRDADGFRPFGLLAGLGSAATRDREEVARLRGLIDRLLIRSQGEARGIVTPLPVLSRLAERRSNKPDAGLRSEEHTSELPSLMRIS